MGLIPAYGGSVSPEKAQKLSVLKTQIKKWARVCDDGSLTNNGECPFGDMTIFAGLLCLSGEKSACENVKNAQSKTGEWFRSPGMKDREQDDGRANFSRDQSKGVLAYLIATQDSEAAVAWMDFIERNDWKLCQKSKIGWDACSPRLTWWSDTTNVWDFLKLPRNKKMGHSNFLVESWYRPIEARYQGNDYPVHLTAVGIYLRQELEKRSGSPDRKKKDLLKLSRIVHERSPNNPFYYYLRYGADDVAADLVLKYCPAEAPAKIDGRDHGEWMWQRAEDDKLDDREKVGDELSWNYPGGHDCVFMINLLLK